MLVASTVIGAMDYMYIVPALLSKRERQIWVTSNLASPALMHGHRRGQNWCFACSGTHANSDRLTQLFLPNANHRAQLTSTLSSIMVRSSQ